MSIIESLKYKNVLSKEEYKNKLMKLNIQLFASSGTLGTLSGLWNTTYTVKWSLVSQSAEDNASIIRLTGTLYTGNTTTISAYDSVFKLDGTTVFSGYYEKSGAGNIFVKTKDITVKHNDDGSFPGRTVSYSASDGYIFNPGQSGSAKISSSDISDIPRASEVLCSSPNIGDVATITIDKKSSSFTSTVTYKIGTLTGTIATKTTKTTLSFATASLKEKIYALIPSAKKISGTITCTTYSGSTQIGDPTTATFNLYAVEDDCKPIVSGTVVDTNESTIALTGDSSIIVKNASKPKVTVTATPQLSSTIKSYSINLNDGQTASSQEYTFDTINSNKVTVSAKDSRGYSDSDDIDLTDRVVNYVKLHFNDIELSRPEGTSTEIVLNTDGVWFNGNFKEDTPNTLSIIYKYRESGSTEWIEGEELTPTINGNKFSFSDLSLGNEFDFEKEYQFQFIATDLLMTVGDSTKEIQTAEKGIAEVEIGDGLVNVNGTLTVNDEDFINKLYEYIDSNARKLKNYTNLEDDTDLNDVIEYGTYRSSSNEHSSTMSNVPVTLSSGFTLYVSGFTSTTANTKYFRQEIIHGVNTFIRYTSDGGSTWTDWKKVKLIDDAKVDINFIKATVTSAQTVSASYPVVLNSRSLYNGSKFSLSDGKIVVGSGVERVRVSGSVFVDSFAGGTAYCWCLLRKNGTAISSSIAGGGSAYVSASVPNTIITVKEGDTIDMLCDSPSGGKLRTGVSNTWLLVEEIQ